ncbi:MAG: FMN-binding protein [candidate division WOR-3 bacterium]|nr:MAG: FMN-binding protein [candidate division WOR-3 bacterium]
MRITERGWYSVAFMFIITLAVSTVLIIFGSATRQRVEDNQRVAFRRAVLEALPIELPTSLSPAQIHTIFTDSVHIDSLLPDVYEFRRNGSVIAYALPFEGPGFWAPIKGIVGIAVDKKTFSGLAIYEQNETPGLGGEIVKSYFRDQFRGKRIGEGESPIGIRPGTDVLDEYSVHAITGATQTSEKFEMLLNARLREWRDTHTGVTP